MDLLDILNKQKRCLTRFKQISKDFLVLAKSGEWSRLSSFHNERDAIIKIFLHYDSQLDQAVSSLDRVQRTKEVLAAIRELNDHKKSLIEEIQIVDQEIIGLIQIQQKDIKNQINQSIKSKSQISRFKSNKAPVQGKELDKKL